MGHQNTWILKKKIGKSFLLHFGVNRPKVSPKDGLGSERKITYKKASFLKNDLISSTPQSSYPDKKVDPRKIVEKWKRKD